MKLLNTQKGITLIELLVAIGVFLMLISAVFTFIKQSYKIQDFSLEQSIAIAEAQRGVDAMVKEIREALPGDTGAFTIDTADEQTLIFYSDFDKDDAIEKVRYYLDGSSFTKGTTESSGSPLQYLAEDEELEIISRYVQNSSTEAIFEYYNGNWPGDTTNNPLATPTDVTDIRLIKIKLRINVRPERAPVDYILESSAALRNLKDNL